MKIILDIPTIKASDSTAKILLEWFESKIGEEESPMRYVISVKIQESEE